MPSSSLRLRLRIFTALASTGPAAAACSSSGPMEAGTAPSTTSPATRTTSPSTSTGAVVDVAPAP
ncbi:MAG: hypothetical protein AAGA56_24340, partial [Myxococcota bacterium]